jgi:hypothetical protein
MHKAEPYATSFSAAGDGRPQSEQGHYRREENNPRHAD